MLWALLVCIGGAQGALRIANYNTCGGVRSGMAAILEAIESESRNGISQPIDILLLQEQESVTTTTAQIVTILNGIYGTGLYARGTLDGESTGAGRPGVIYNTQTVELLGELQVNTTSDTGAARSTIRYQFRPVGYSSPDAVFYIYNSHYKASDSSDDRARRAVEAAQVRANADALGEGVHILYAGDLNLYTSAEAAWGVLTGSGNGQASDPAGRVGDWSDNTNFTDVHTQSPVTWSRYGGQVTGGMDDRFDFQLASGEFLDGEGLSFISGSYFTLGNNDTHGLNNEISDGTGASPAVLTALTETSDHLPVSADYQVPAKMTVGIGPIPSEIIYNSPAAVEVTVENTAAVTVEVAADVLDYVLSTTGALSGSAVDWDPATGGGNTHWVTLTASSIGPQSGQIVVTASSQGAEDALFVQDVYYTVVQSYTRQTIDYGWEDFTSRYDPQAALGAAGTASYAAVTSDPNEGSRCLEAANAGDCASEVYLAVVYDLLEDDLVEVTCQGRHFDSGDTGLCIGADYLADWTDMYSAAGSAGADSGLSTVTWGGLSSSWTFDEGSGQNEAMVIKVKLCDLAGGGAVDRLSITVPDHASVWLPSPTEITCPDQPEMDFDGDCRVNLADYADMAAAWLDGETGGQPAGSLNTVLITGILDGTLTGSTPKVMELYVDGTHDLSQYTVQQSIDGAAWNAGFSLSGTYSNTYVYVIRSNNSGVSYFDSIFGSGGAFANRIPLADVLYCDNGNDGFRIVKDSVIIDQVYDRNSTQVYRDSFLYRIDATGPDGGTWTAANWTFGGNDLLDFKTAAQIAALVPFGTYRISSECTEYPEMDFVADCRIDLLDLEVFIEQWMDCSLQPAWACWE